MFDRARNFLRRKFSKTLTLPDEQIEEIPRSSFELDPQQVRTVRRISTKSRKTKHRNVVVPPSERFVWAMIFLFVALIGTIVLQAIHLIVLHIMNSELTTIISGLISSIITAVLLESKR